MLAIEPKNYKDVYWKPINLDKYDFSTAQAYLVASVNGKFSKRSLNNYG